MFHIILLLTAISICGSDPKTDPTSSLNHAYNSPSSAHYSPSSFHSEMSQKYAEVSDKHQKYMDNENCADLYRSLIPYTEEMYMNVSKFSDDFTASNAVYASIMRGYFFSYDRKKDVDNILHELNLQFKDRKTCSFEQWTEKPETGSMMSSEVQNQNRDSKIGAFFALKQKS